MARRRSTSPSLAEPVAVQLSSAVLVEDRKRRVMPPPTRGIVWRREGATRHEKTVGGDPTSQAGLYHESSQRGAYRPRSLTQAAGVLLPQVTNRCSSQSRPTSLPTGEISGSLSIDRFRFEGIPPSTSPASAEPPQGNPAPAAFSPGEAISSPSDQGAMFRLFHPDFAGPTPGPSNPIPRSFWEPLSRSWSHFVGLYRQKLSKSSKIDF